MIRSVFTKKNFKENRAALLIGFICAIFYGVFAYDLDRTDFVKLISLSFGLFIAAHQLIQKFGYSFWLLAALGIVFRIIALPAFPNLSQDFYRFLWDGRLLVQGINPYLTTPLMHIGDASIALEGTPKQALELYAGMGDLNGSHFSNYPPINQLCFGIASLFTGNSILGSAIVLRLLIILADIGILYFGKKLLQGLGLPIKNIFWYFLNPFIIIELTGNLHFEGVMLFFVVWSLYSLHKRQWLWAAVLWGISISVKLIPLLLLPLFVKYLMDLQNKKANFLGMRFDKSSLSKIVGFYSIVLLTATITFAPFLSSEFVSNFAATLSLWFQDFEFNASIYYIIRWIGFQTIGWNIIESIGKILPLIVIFILLLLAFFRRNTNTQQLISAMVIGMFCYFLLSTTVHPWYVATPLVLCVFTKYRFPIVWSFMVFFSYSAYGSQDFSENLWLVAIEYLVVIGVAIWELFFRKTKKLKVD